MIVVNPPTPPATMQLASQTAEHRAVEWALQIARVPYSCAESIGPVAWMQELTKHGADATFVVHVDPPQLVLVESGQAAASPTMVIDGHDGVIALAVHLGRLAAT